MLLVSTATPEFEIAENLGISYTAMKVRAHQIFKHFGVTSRLELMVQYHSREINPCSQ